MSPRPLPSCQMRRREVIFAKAYRKILVLTQETLNAHTLPQDDPELSVGDLSIDAAFGAALAYDALYWSCPRAFATRSDDYLSAFVVKCAAVSVAGEIDRILMDRVIDDEVTCPIGSRDWPGGSQRIPGFSIIQPV